ncbi:MAG: site-specific integrase [Thermoguttaceae bacterium]|jgi:integrase
MPNLFRPKYTKVDPKTGEKVTRQARKWYGRVQDADGVMRRVALCTDKTAAQAMLLTLICDTERRIAGLVDPATDQLTRPISAHIGEYQTHLVANARSESHIGETIRLIKRVVKECRYRVLADLQSGGDTLEEYLAKRREKGSAHRTINADLVAVRSFCRCLMSKKKMREDPTLGLHRLNVEEDRRRERRPLTDEEAQRLIDAAFHSTRVFKKLTGKDRAVMYTLAQQTGLRRGELRSLKSASFDFESTPATVQVEAADSKRRKRDLLPLPNDVAETMRKYLAGRPSQESVWPGSWWQRSAEMLRLDLSEAKIEPVDAQGRVVDFHGQRMTFISALARAGVSPATAQKLARHSDINLTMGTYTRLQMADMAGAVDKLSELGPVRPSQAIGLDSARSARRGRSEPSRGPGRRRMGASARTHPTDHSYPGGDLVGRQT